MIHLLLCKQDTSDRIQSSIDHRKSTRRWRNLRASLENFVFKNKPINRFNFTESDEEESQSDKAELLHNLEKKINSIENCNLKDNSKNLVLGDGNINSPIMLIGEAPGIEEDKDGIPFKGEIGELLNKMLQAIEIKRKNISAVETRHKFPLPYVNIAAQLFIH